MDRQYHSRERGDPKTITQKRLSRSIDQHENAPRMDYSDSGSASTWHQRNNKHEGKVDSAWQKGPQNNVQNDGRRLAATQHKSPRKKIQDDGRKLKKKEGEQPAAGMDMSDLKARSETFKHFEKKEMINRLVESGYCYTGKDDKTQCYKCGAVVYDWTEKDNPATFHEPHCSYNAYQSAEQMKEFDHKEGCASYEESHMSLLDTPITESNDLLPPPVLLKPTPANADRLHREAPVQPTTESPFTSMSLPLPEEKVTSIDPGRVSSLGHQKIFPSKHGRPNVRIAEVLTYEHHNLLLRLNLWSEDDRRMSFIVDGKWEQNTNNVISPYELAKDGFFYLGNLDRTQCCWCHNVFKNWARKDRVNVVHRISAPSCRLAKGEPTKNVPIQNWRADANMPLRFKDFEPIATIPGSNHSEVVTLGVLPPSHQAQHAPILEATKPYYTKPVLPTIPVPTCVGGSPNHLFETGPITAQNEPLDLSHGRRALSLSPRVSTEDKQNMSVTAHSFPYSAPKVSVTQLTEPMPASHSQPSSTEETLQTPIYENLHNLPPPTEISRSMDTGGSRQDPFELEPRMATMPLLHGSLHAQETVVQKPEYGGYVTPPEELPPPEQEGSFHSLGRSSLERTHNSPIYEVTPKDPYRGIQPQSTSSSPDEEMSSQAQGMFFIDDPPPSIRPLPPVCISSHIGQTTLYNTPVSMPSITREESIPRISPSIPSVSNVPSIVPTMPFVGRSETNWSDIFPCNEPSNPNFRTAIVREETYDYRWPCTRLQASIADYAKAGFYYMGNGDHVRCWYCNGGVVNWNGDDDPWEEHARLYPTCEFVLQQKGPEYVSDVSARNTGSTTQPAPGTTSRFHTSYSSSSSPGFSTPGSSPRFGTPTPGSPTLVFARHNVVNRFGNSPPRVIDPRVEEAQQKREIERALNSEAVLSAMEMGFEMNKIKKVIKHKIRSSGVAFGNAEALMEALLGFNEANTSDSSDSEMEAENSPGATPSTSGGPENPTTTGGASSLMPAASTGTNIPQPQPRPSPLEGAEGLDPKQLDERLREYQQAKRCKVCLDRDADVVFVPCGHLCTCVQCAGALRTCPLCRKRIQKSIKTYTS